jgi:DNA-directed RNA polymerase subunit RPC12/RpoP
MLFNAKSCSQTLTTLNEGQATCEYCAFKTMLKASVLMPKALVETALHMLIYVNMHMVDILPPISQIETRPYVPSQSEKGYQHKEIPLPPRFSCRKTPTLSTRKDSLHGKRYRKGGWRVVDIGRLPNGGRVLYSELQVQDQNLVEHQQ